ncbi:MAG: hypothetical protein KBT20_02235 [Bacteroidales bacterium]|nr:hypothetical protein [Candidatus Liminaster caballi]
MCDESDDGHGYEWISADYFCLGNYEFPTTDYYSCLRDSGNLLYYCPGTQDQLYFRGYLTKERFAQSTRPVKACVDAPDSWHIGQPYAFCCSATGEVMHVTKIRINDPDAVLVLDEQGKTESLYGKYVYTVDNAGYENIFYREILDVYTESYDPDLTLKVNSSGYFSIVNSKTHQETPTSSVQRYPDLPDFSYLYFIDDSTITIDQLVYHKAEEKCEVIYDIASPMKVCDAPSSDVLDNISTWLSKGSYCATSGDGQFEYNIEVLADTCDDDADIIDYHAVKISCGDRVQAVELGEFRLFYDYRHENKVYNSYPFHSVQLDNTCTLLIFEKDDRPCPPILSIFALKDGHVSHVYDRTGYIKGLNSRRQPISIKLLSSLEQAEYEICEGVMHFTPATYYYLIISDGKLLRFDYR